MKDELGRPMTLLAGIALSISNIFAFVGGAAGLLITIAGMFVRGKNTTEI